MLKVAAKRNPPLVINNSPGTMSWGL